ncbi:phosphoadenosine phosphosulfate reductase family protein [Pseudomonas sp. P66]|uniref:Phosphoadenosine phosphosulfate reductase family protein n=1 Tax=Pseudomonas arcuscaelestis TaxID=2710591 RepID=A0ABS2BZR4_9PSED|nr:phosphoadenosine phosphosulfate reductase family protein [Pseudomonas arcuscaelestis]MBM5458543.1 phosphoadenosine phosphosulfate reductase family protein [Pseudomonas arcuscaelestis]
MTTLPPVATTPEIDVILNQKTVVAFGVSGGKDSIAGLIATHRYLDSIGFMGPRCAIHADLGSVEWSQSMFKCQEAADKLGWGMEVAARPAGGMMERWLSRWNANAQRYIDLSCVQLILPWSTPSMRFCTSELKVAVIRSRLKKLYPDYNIVNATGIRREESSSRAKMPVAKSDPLTARRGFEAYQWNPIIEWNVSDVWAAIASEGLEPHEAYLRYNMTRVSCRWCIMSSAPDLYNATQDEAGHPLYRQMVGLEAESTFAFQSNKWLGDVNPGLLSSETQDRLQLAKQVSSRRKVLEAAIPKHLRFEKQWPTCIPSLEEASLLADIRAEVGAGVGLNLKYSDAHSIIQRYEELTALKLIKQGNSGDDAPGVIRLIPAVQIQPQQLTFF